MGTHVLDGAALLPPPAAPLPAAVALLGCGNVGTALLQLLADSPAAEVQVASALVRDSGRPRALPAAIPLTEDARILFAHRPAVVVELLGGVEPARSLVLQALADGIPVVTANKTLLARCGGELIAAAAATGTPLLYEAAVLAGVPFLGTFARRPHAAAATGLAAIANGTSNFVLTLCARDQRPFAAALETAQALGYAEPQPHNDVAGIDAVEKLAVLLRQFGGFETNPDHIETEGISHITASELAHARQLGGVVKPVILASWSQRLEAFAGPAFVPREHPLASVDGVENALLLESTHGRLLFQGPGAGPVVTAATVLDDVHEVLGGAGTPLPRTATAAAPGPVESGWMLSIAAARLPRGGSIADLLAAFGVYTRRTTDRTRADDGAERTAFLTWPVERDRLEAALDALRHAAGCTTSHIRALESDR